MGMERKQQTDPILKSVSVFEELVQILESLSDNDWLLPLHYV